MSQVSQLLQDLSKHSDVMKKCTRPLIHLGITCFYYVCIKNNGDYMLLTDCPHIDEYYFDEKLYIQDPYMRHPSHYQTGFFLFEENQKDKFDQSLAYIVDNFRMTPLIGYCEKKTDAVEFYGFWRKTDRTSSFMPVHHNYFSLLRVFVNHFKEECKSILQSTTIPYLSLGDLMGNEFVASAIDKRKDHFDHICKYLEEIGLGYEVKKAELLSPRERECVKLLLQGKSAKESGCILNLSYRTVEYYMESVKNKLKCQYKNEIFSAAERLNELGLL